jgi:dienelactone hydrolase
VLDQLALLNADDPLLAGGIDLDRVGIMGWSFGGGTAAEACRLEDQVKAAVLLDAYLQSAPLLLRNGVGKPFLALTSPTSGLASDSTAIFNRATNSAYLATIKDASHESFTDNAWIVNPSAASRRPALAMNACMVSFFKRHLLGVEDSRLDDPVSSYPDVTSFGRK